MNTVEQICDKHGCEAHRDVRSLSTAGAELGAEITDADLTLASLLPSKKPDEQRKQEFTDDR